MERKAGIVEGYWTAHAARQGAMLTAHLVPREAEEVLGVLGNMTPSKSSLDRLPKALSARWEAQRPQFEARVREETLEVADTARTVAVSLDGVMAPMKTGGGGYREASCASVSLYDGEGERLSTVRMARMPESKKVTLKTMVGAEVEAVLGQRPDLQLVKIADGANDNWTFLSRVLPRASMQKNEIGTTSASTPTSHCLAAEAEAERTGWRDNSQTIDSRARGRCNHAVKRRRHPVCSGQSDNRPAARFRVPGVGTPVPRNPSHPCLPWNYRLLHFVALITWIDHASVKPFVQVGTQIQDAIPEFDVSRPVSATSPLGERAAGGDQGEFRVVCTVVAIILESCHGSLPKRRPRHDIHDNHEFARQLGRLVCGIRLQRRRSRMSGRTTSSTTTPPLPPTEVHGHVGVPGAPFSLRNRLRYPVTGHLRQQGQSPAPPLHSCSRPLREAAQSRATAHSAATFRAGS